jgi:hypothetical protein
LDLARLILKREGMTFTSSPSTSYTLLFIYIQQTFFTHSATIAVPPGVTVTKLLLGLPHGIHLSELH